VPRRELDKSTPLIGLVGCGVWGRYILRDLTDHLGCEVVVVARSDATRRRAQEGGASRIVSTVNEMGDVDGAVVATPTSSHYEVLQELLAVLPPAAPIYVEKPVTNSAHDADSLLEAAPQRIFVMDKWRYHGGVRALAAIAQSGELGPVEGLHTIRVGWGNPHTDVDGIWILLPHDLSIALEILGALPPARCAVADGQSAEPSQLHAHLGVDPWAVIEVSTRRLQRQREVCLYCRDGMAILPDAYARDIQIVRGRPDLNTNPPPAEDRPIPTEMPLLLELRAFVEHTRGGPPPKSSLADGVRIVHVIADLRALAGLPA